MTIFVLLAITLAQQYRYKIAVIISLRARMVSYLLMEDNYMITTSTAVYLIAKSGIDAFYLYIYVSLR